MSYTELNKGRMIPVEESIEEIAQKVITTLDTKYYASKVEEFRAEAFEYGYEFFRGKLYKMEFDIQGDNTLDYVDVVEDDNGVIEFTTIHYNGGASLLEVIDQGLDR